MPKVTFKYSDETSIFQKLVDAVNALCVAKNKDCLCTSGYRSLEKQKVINAQVLAQSKSNYQLKNGAVYNKLGQCLASAYGASNHCFCIALDITDEWFKALKNADLAKYGLIKPMSYEPWHVQLIEHQGISQEQKTAIKNSVMKGGKKDMTIKEFQALTGLVADGIIGAKTKAKAQEVLEICQEILNKK